MNPTQYYSRFLRTRRAVRSGQPLWNMPDDAAAEAGYLTAGTFNRVQNVAAVVIASPLILLGAEGRPTIDEQILGLSTLTQSCYLAWLGQLWSKTSALLLAALAPILVSKLVLLILNARPRTSEVALRAYKYQNAASTFATKIGFLSLYGLLLVFGAGAVALYSFVENTGGLFPGPDDAGQDVELLLDLLTFGPITLALALLSIPVWHYCKFLVRYANWMRQQDAVGGTAERKYSLIRLSASGVVAIVAATTLFLLSAVAPQFGEAVIDALACSALGIPP